MPRAALATLVARRLVVHAGRRPTAPASGRAAAGRCGAGCSSRSRLGALFLANQIAEYATLDFGADDHPYGSIYWLLTGLHGAHVTAGLGAMALLFVRAVRARSPRRWPPWADGVSLFWHLVDVIWLFVFSTIWLLQ